MRVLKVATAVSVLFCVLSSSSYADSDKDSHQSAKERQRIETLQAEQLRTSDYISSKKGPRKTLLQAPINKKDALPESQKSKDKKDD